MLGLIKLETSSIISLLTKIEPKRACSASKFDGCLFSWFLIGKLTSLSVNYKLIDV